MPWLLAAALLLVGGCRARLPVDPPVAEALPTPAADPARAAPGLASRWLESTDGTVAGAARTSRFGVEIPLDRLENAVCVRGGPAPGGFLSGFFLHVDTCTPYDHR
jgi:hypothetical protein